MKIVKVILMIFLVLKSSSAFSVSSISFSCCTSDDTEIGIDQEENNDEQKDDCCDGGMCSCLCCGHIFIPVSITAITLNINSSFEDVSFQYKNNYFFQIKEMIWHPPQIV